MSRKQKSGIFGIQNLDKKYSDLSGHFKDSWLEESFVFDRKTKKQVVTTGSREYIGSSLSLKKIKFLLFFLLIFFLIIVSRLFFLQIIKGDYYILLSEGNREKIIPIPSERGLIYDRNGVQLTKNIPSFSLALIPQELPRDKEGKSLIIKRLSEIVGKTEEELSNLLNEYGSYSYESIVIYEDLDYQTALSILIESSDLPGIDIHRGSKRLYVDGLKNEDSEILSLQSLGHLIGYQSKLNKQELDELRDSGYLSFDLIGKTGIEKVYESLLRGSYGKKRIEVNASGREQSILAEKMPVPGLHLLLSLDIEMQSKLEEIISKSLEKNNKSKAIGIVLNPSTGEILAMVSLPGFNNNDFSGGISQEKYSAYINNKDKPLFNRAIAGTYPSGSTIKPAVALAALQEGIINKNTSFLSNGGLQISKWFFPDWQAGGHGNTNVRRSLAWSVNTFYYYIGGGYGNFEGLGVEKIVDYLKKFNFAKKLGVDLPGEQAGFLPSKEWKQEKKNEMWYIGDTYNLSIGQGDLLVTPLQIASMTATIANGGILYKPHLVKSVVEPVENKINNLKPEILNANFINRNNVETVRLGMKDCVTYASCRRLSLLPFSSAGKTGTAQWSNNKENHAWFTSFAPFDNPEVVVTVLVEEGGQGSEVAAPIVYEFLRWWGEYSKS